MLLLAWILYFGIWGVSFLMMHPPKSKLVFAFIAALSAADIIYLAVNDGRTLLLVILATVFAVAGVSRSIVFGMRAGKEDLDRPDSDLEEVI